MHKLCVVILFGCFILVFFNQKVHAAITSFDTTFNGSGYVHNNIAGENIGYKILETSTGYYIIGRAYAGGGEVSVAIWKYNADGTLDTSFDTDGRVIYNGGGGQIGEDMGIDAELLSDGKILVAAHGTNPGFVYDVVLWRINPDGSLDTTFNSVGYISHNIGNEGDAHNEVHDMLMLSDGRFILVSAHFNLLNANDFDLLLWRFNADGSLDTTFNSTGYVLHHNAGGGGSADTPEEIQIQADGKYVVVGQSAGPTNYDMVVWRFNENGTLDTTFNSSGYKSFPAASGSFASSIAIDEDGNYVITGGIGSEMAVWRLTPDGNLDSSFGVAGIATFASTAGGNSDDGQKIYILPNNKYVVVGASRAASTYYDMAIWKLNNDGSLDTSFNGTGYITHNNAAGGNRHDRGFDFLLQQDGKYVISGYSYRNVSTANMAIWRISNLFQILNLDPAYDAELNGVNIEEGTVAGGYGEQTIDLSSGGIEIAQISAELYEDLDWSTLELAIDTNGYKALLNGETGASSVTEYALLVPYDQQDHNSIFICPGATTLETISLECVGGYYLVLGVDAEVEEVNIDGQDYLRISGLVGDNGGLAAFYTADSAPSPTPTLIISPSPTLAATGQSVYNIFVFVMLLCSLTLVFLVKVNATKYHRYMH